MKLRQRVRVNVCRQDADDHCTISFCIHLRNRKECLRTRFFLLLIDAI